MAMFADLSDLKSTQRLLLLEKHGHVQQDIAATMQPTAALARLLDHVTVFCC